MRELKPDKPSKNGGRRSKTSGIHEGGAVCEAGTSHALTVEAVRWKQGSNTQRLYDAHMVSGKTEIKFKPWQRTLFIAVALLLIAIASLIMFGII